MSGRDVAIDMTDSEKELNFDWNKHEIGDDVSQKYLKLKNQIYTLRDLYKGENIGKTSENLRANIGAHDVLMVRLSR